MADARLEIVRHQPFGDGARIGQRHPHALGRMRIFGLDTNRSRHRSVLVFVEVLAEALQPAPPEFFVRPHPVANLLERLGIEPVVALTPLAALGHQTGAPEDAKLLRNTGQRHVVRFGEGEYGLLAVAELVQDCAANWMRDREEDVGVRVKRRQAS
jgi:hypothetical protein